MHREELCYIKHERDLNLAPKEHRFVYLILYSALLSGHMYHWVFDVPSGTSVQFDLLEFVEQRAHWSLSSDDQDAVQQLGNYLSDLKHRVSEAGNQTVDSVYRQTLYEYLAALKQLRRYVRTNAYVFRYTRNNNGGGSGGGGTHSKPPLESHALDFEYIMTLMRVAERLTKLASIKRVAGLRPLEKTDGGAHSGNDESKNARNQALTQAVYTYTSAQGVMDEAICVIRESLESTFDRLTHASFSATTHAPTHYSNTELDDANAYHGATVAATTEMVGAHWKNMTGDARMMRVRKMVMIAHEQECMWHIARQKLDAGLLSDPIKAGNWLTSIQVAIAELYDQACRELDEILDAAKHNKLYVFCRIQSRFWYASAQTRAARTEWLNGEGKQKDESLLKSAMKRFHDAQESIQTAIQLFHSRGKSFMHGAIQQKLENTAHKIQQAISERTDDVEQVYALDWRHYTPEPITASTVRAQKEEFINAFGRELSRAEDSMRHHVIFQQGYAVLQDRCGGGVGGGRRNGGGGRQNKPAIVISEQRSSNGHDPKEASFDMLIQSIWIQCSIDDPQQRADLRTALDEYVRARETTAVLQERQNRAVDTRVLEKVDRALQHSDTYYRALCERLAR